MILHAALMVLSLGQPAKPDWPRLLHTLEPWAGGLAFSPDGKTLAAAVWDPDQPPPDRSRWPDTLIATWDVAKGQQLATLKGHKDVRALAYSPDGKMLASAGTGIRVWDIATRKPIASTQDKPDLLIALDYSSDGKRVATGASFNRGTGSAIGVWEADTLKPVASPKDIKASRAVVFSPDGKTLAFEEGNIAHLWDMNSGQDRLAIKADGLPGIASLSFSPDGKMLAMGRMLRTLNGPIAKNDFEAQAEVTTWDTATGKQIRRLEGHTRGVLSVAFSPDGKLLASCSRDGTARVWDVASGRSLAKLEIEKDATAGLLAFSPDGKTLAVASAAESQRGENGESRRTIRLWSLEGAK